MAEWSSLEPPRAATALNSSWAVAVLGRATCKARAEDSARFRSFWCSSMPEARIEIALHHALAMHFQDAGSRKATHQRLAHLGRIGAGLGGEQQRLAHRLDGQATMIWLATLVVWPSPLPPTR